MYQSGWNNPRSRLSTPTVDRSGVPRGGLFTDRPLSLGIILLGNDSTAFVRHEVSAALAVATDLVSSFLHNVVLGLSVREIKESLFGAARTAEDLGPIIPPLLVVGYSFDIFVDES